MMPMSRRPHMRQEPMVAELRRQFHGAAAWPALVLAGGYHDCASFLGRRRAVRLLRLEEDPRGDRLALREVLRGRQERVAIRQLQFEPFVVEELEGLLGVLAFLLSLGLLFFPPLCLRLGLLRQEARVRRAFLLSVLFADLLFLVLGVTSTSRAVLISVLFADLLFLRLGVTRTSRAVLIIVLFADVLLLRLGVTRTSRAVLIIVLFADVLFLLLLPARN